MRFGSVVSGVRGGRTAWIEMIVWLELLSTVIHRPLPSYDCCASALVETSTDPTRAVATSPSGKRSERNDIFLCPQYSPQFVCSRQHGSLNTRELPRHAQHDLR